MPKMIFSGFSPNLTKRDTQIALSFLFLPWKWSAWQSSLPAEMVEYRLRKYFGTKQAICFDSGRTALYFALRAMGAGKGDEVLLQAFTCLVVHNAIVATGAKPVYVDIDGNFNMSASDLQKKISCHAKILIIQHTFGCPAETEALLEIARENNMLVIEDCAHSFGGRYEGKLTGTWGDIGLLSFGSDKSLSCVRGGALITDNLEFGAHLKDFQNQLVNPPKREIVRHLLHYPFFYVGKKLYSFGIGKYILAFGKKFGLINKVIDRKEKAGGLASFPQSRLAAPLAEILLLQLDEIDLVNRHRQEISDFYSEHLNFSKQKKSLAYLRYPYLSTNREKLMRAAKRKNIILGDWYHSIIAPRDNSLKDMAEISRSCPNAEKASQQILNLPTDLNIGINEEERIINFIKEYENRS